MKKCADAQGVTIIEAMIFLAVTGLLLISALAVFNGRISRTQFTNSVRELDAQLRTVTNDVASGLFPDTQGFTCTAASGNGPHIEDSGMTEQGTNTDCIFLGKVIQFGPAKGGCSVGSTSGCDQINVITVVGQRHTSTDKEVTTLAEAKPLAIAPGTSDNPDNEDITNTITLPYGVEISRVIQQSPAPPCPCDVGSVAITQSLGKYSGTDVVSGSQSLQVIPVPNTLVGDPINDISADIKSSLAGGSVNPGVVVCLVSGTSNQRAAIRIGTNKREITTDVFIDSTEVQTLCS